MEMGVAQVHFGFYRTYVGLILSEEIKRLSFVVVEVCITDSIFASPQRNQCTQGFERMEMGVAQVHFGF